MLLPHALGMPQYATAGAAGMDLQAAIASPLRLMPRTPTLVPTGIAVELPSWFEMQIRPRSGLAAKHGITVVNSPCTIDADYRGEIMVALINLTDTPHMIQPGDRIAQVVVAPVCRVAWSQVDALDDTERGAGGFGSTRANAMSMAAPVSY